MHGKATLPSEEGGLSQGGAVLEVAMAAAEDAEDAGNAELVLAADRQSLQLQVVKTVEEAAQVGAHRS